MARRRGSFTNVPVGNGDARASIGDFAVNDAITKLNTAAQRAVALMTTYEHTRESTIPMLFRDQDIAALTQVRGMVQPRSNIEAYDVDRHVRLSIDYEDAFVPAILPSRLLVHPNRSAPLRAYIAAVRAIHDQYQEVVHVLRWLNRNATPGAIRYYWPAAMQLCPHSTAFKDLEHVPARYSVPPGIGDHMQLLRDAAACVVSMTLLPKDSKPTPRGTMWLTFAQTSVKKGDATYQTDQMIYNI